MQVNIADYLTTMQLEDILSLTSIALTCIGGVGALLQWDRTNKINSATYINELTDKIRSDDDIRETLYKLEYDGNWYNQNFHSSGEPELKLDKTLSYFSYICYLRHMKIISEKEFSFFKYEIIRILGNGGIQGYLFNLYHFSRRIGTPMIFHYLFEYGNKHGMFSSAFYVKDTAQYEKYLNF